MADSDIAASTLKRAEIYPDSDDTADPLGEGPDEIYDRIEFKYNRRRELIETKDQNGTVHAYDYGQLRVDGGQGDRSFRENWSVRRFSLKNFRRPKHRSCWSVSAESFCSNGATPARVPSCKRVGATACRVDRFPALPDDNPLSLAGNRTMPDAERPIFISGLGRSGTTWMQWFLSQHPRIHVHGQLPNGFWETTQTWFQTLLEQGQWAEAANRQVGYDIAHYAGSGPERCRQVFRCMYRDFLTGQGPDRPRWGLKLIGLCADPAAVAQLETLWPEARWVVCLRDPFMTINSTRNTFVPDVDPREHARSWVAVWRFLETHDPQRVVAVPMDRLQHRPEEQRPAIDRLLACIGEPFCPELERFLKEWPVVHKVVPDVRRSYQLSAAEQRRLLREVPDLDRCLRQFRETGQPLSASAVS